MALRGIKPRTVQKRLKAFFYGNAKVGKTTAAIQFPRPYLIDTERGAENKQYVDILEEKNGLIFQTNDFEEVIKEVMALLTEKHEYKTLIVDPLTTLYNDLVEKAGNKIGTDFGRHYNEANKRIKHLYNLLTRLDMNVIITSHAKNEYGPHMSVIGQTFDCYKKMDYLFDLILEIQKRGKKERVAIIRGSRIQGFPEDETFSLSYDEICNRYGREIMEKECEVAVLASSEQIREIKHLIDLLNIPEGTVEKWLDKSNSEKIEEMPQDAIIKCIDFLKSKIQGEAA